MRDLIKQEQFELEVLDRLQSGRFLDRLVFGGGTMLRLCYGLDRYSVDLDFWLRRKKDKPGFEIGFPAIGRSHGVVFRVAAVSGPPL
jgi:hypothetical protein